MNSIRIRLFILLFLPLFAYALTDSHYPARWKFQEYIHKTSPLPYIDFREPIRYTFFEFNTSFGQYGRDGLNIFAFDKHTLSFDSTETALIELDWNFLNRLYLDMDMSILRYNWLYKIFPQNYIDYLSGFGVRNMMQLIPVDLNSGWINDTFGLGVYNYVPIIYEGYYSHTFYYQPIERITTRFEISKGYGKGFLYKTVGSQRLLELQGQSTRYMASLQWTLKMRDVRSKFIFSANAFLHSGTYDISDPDNISPIEALNFNSYGVGVSLYILLGGNKTNGDKGMKSVRRRDYIQAKTEFSQYMIRYPNSLKNGLAKRYVSYCDSMTYFQYYLQANEALRSMKLKDALLLYEKAFASKNIDLRRKVIEKRNFIGEVFVYNSMMSIQKGDFSRAESVLKKAQELSPFMQSHLKMPRSYINILKAQSLINAGLYDRAEFYLKLAEELNPKLSADINVYKQKIASGHIEHLNKAIENSDLYIANESLKKAILMDDRLEYLSDTYTKKMEKKIDFFNNQLTNRDFEKAFEKLKSDRDALKTINVGVMKAEVGMTLVEILDTFGEPLNRETIRQNAIDYELFTYKFKDKTLFMYFHNYYLTHIEEILESN